MKKLINIKNINSSIFIIFIIFIFSLFSRFLFLDLRAVHHDESLHGYYSWLLSNGFGYEHNPLMHGPLNFHLNAISFLIFGDSDFSLRVAPALIGSILVITPYLFKDYIGKHAAIMLSLIFLFSPVLLYFSRFARNDIFIAFMSVLLIHQIFKIIYGEPKRLYFILISTLLGLIFCTKEISFIIIFIIGSFSLLLSTLNPFIKDRTKVNKNFTDIFYLLFLLTFPLSVPIISFLFNILDINLVAPSGSIYEIGMPIGRDAQIISIFISVLAILISFICGLFKFKKNWLIYFFTFWLIFILFHSTFLTNPFGVITGFWQSLGYWIAQQDVGRGGQPWYYYFLILLKFEFLSFLSLFFFVLYKKFKFTIFELFLIYWSSLNLLIYIFTSEKMPWLTVNIIIPFMFIFSIIATHFFNKIYKSNLILIYKVNILIIPLFLFLVSIFNSFETNYIEPDKPDEMIVYTQTSKYVHELSKEIISEIKINDAKVLIDSSDGYTWPWAWYMRNYNVDYFDSNKQETYKNLILNNYDYILINSYNFSGFIKNNEDNLSYNEISQIPFRMWFPENYRFGSFKDFFNHIKNLNNISYIFGHTFKKEFDQNIGNVGITILK